MNALKSRWLSLPPRLRTTIQTVLKLVLTVGAFVLLFSHKVEDTSGDRITIWQAIVQHLGTLQMKTFLPWVLAATAIKFVGIVCSMFRWHLLLLGQGIRFNFGHLAGSFLIGRFLGTFLPSTVGLDGYKLYDASRFSGRSVEVAAATLIEKAFGFSGVFVTFLVTLPLGVHVLGPSSGLIAAITVPIALGVVASLFLVLFQPSVVTWFLNRAGFVAGGRFHGIVQRVSAAAAAYRGKGGMLLSVLVLSFGVHFFTAAMYYFTAIAVGAADAGFWEVTFASSIQIFATVVSPFTIAGEGIREIAQAWLLSAHMGASESVLSAALGFWAAEAMTLVGGIIWWLRPQGYQPRTCEVQDLATPQAGAQTPDAVTAPA